MPGRAPSEKVTESVLEKCNGKVLLSFSCGKDAIAAWIALRRAGAKVFPYYYYLVPDLQFVEESIRYYEDFFGERILRVPNPSLYRMLQNCVFQSPDNLPQILSASLPSFDHEQLADAVRHSNRLPADTFDAIGVRATDSINRRANFKRSGAVNLKARKFYPVWDWTKEAVRVELFKAKVRLPIDYWIFGRTFDGLDYRFTGPIKRHFPDDYERIKAFFPLVDAEMKRAEMTGRKDHLCPTTS